MPFCGKIRAEKHVYKYVEEDHMPEMTQNCLIETSHSESKYVNERNKKGERYHSFTL